MKIDPTMPSPGEVKLPATTPTEQAEAGVFASVLENEQGTQSPEQIAQFDTLKESFSTWRSELDTTHPLNLPRYEQVMENSDSFLSIVEKAVQEDGYSDPVAFVNGLSPADRDTLTAMHSMVDLDTSKLTQEGALNLLLPFNEAKDIDNDGFVELGNSAGWRFPSPNAPQSVHDAWEKTTEELSPGEAMLATGMFMPSMIRLDEATGEGVEVDRSEANNPYARADFSYSGMVEQRLESLEAFKHYIPAEQYETQKALLTLFGENLASA
ncbi:hypothetical protein MLD52_03940 [Puniceicoccaceae bacterium K14]|nr:hypothetical protein [Puniceicoccaceae bacterium K14]